MFFRWATIDFMSTVISPPILKVSLPISSSIRVTYPEIAILSPTFVFSGGSITSSPTSIFGSIQRFWSGTRLSQEVPNLHALGRACRRDPRGVKGGPPLGSLTGFPPSRRSVEGTKHTQNFEDGFRFQGEDEKRYSRKEVASNCFRCATCPALLTNKLLRHWFRILVHETGSVRSYVR